jgi:hypothetical protein
LKNQLNDKLESIKRAEKPLAKVNLDLCGLKPKDELIDVVKLWYAEIADLREIINCLWS